MFWRFGFVLIACCATNLQAASPIVRGIAPVGGSTWHDR